MSNEMFAMYLSAPKSKLENRVLFTAYNNSKNT